MTQTPSLIVIRYGEISLKTPYVRTSFEHRLITNIHHALHTHDLTARITKEPGRIYLHTTPTPQIHTILAHISGIVTYSPAHQTTADLTTLTETALTLTKPLLNQHTSFALRVTRTGSHPYTSQDAARTIGAAIQHHTHTPVDLTHPAHELHIDIRGNRAYLFTTKHPGIGGLPVGTQGTAAVLLDTPASLLAAWYLMRRGCALHLITTHSTEETPLHAFLNDWYLTSPITSLDQTAPDFYDHLRTLTTRHHLDALVTGATRDDPVQTIHWLSTLKAEVPLPLLTPLIALTKTEAQSQAADKGVRL